MSCERYQRLLHLNRSGEISKHEADELRQHLRLCEKCSLELQRIERADGFIDHLGDFSPSPKNPEKLTADILRRVRAESAAPKPLNPLNRFLDFFLLPSVRYSTVAIISLVILTSATQLVMMLNDVSNLEQRMASPVRHDATEATYTMQSKTLQEVAKSERGRPIKENVSLTVTNDRIDVSAKKVDTFLSDYNLRNLSTVLGASALGIDKKTLEKIVNEVKATAERSFRLDGKGA
ncbi:MAG: zf-HC2 domain-containing protein [Ignavibacteriales bacterium]|nr:zf-HC2 domain-containing protein [Ignavibacteriales bacterium]